MNRSNVDNNDTRSWHKAKRSRKAKHSARQATQKGYSFSRKAQAERDSARAAFFYQAVNNSTTPQVDYRWRCSEDWIKLVNTLYPQPFKVPGEPVTGNLDNLSKLRQWGQAGYLALLATSSTS